MSTNDHFGWFALPVRTRTQLGDAISRAVWDAATSMTGVDVDAADVTEEQRKAHALARVQIWRAVRGEVSREIEAAVESAAWYGASGSQIARATGLGGGSQANKQWPSIGATKRARKWMREHRGEVIATAAAFFALADRMRFELAEDDMQELRATAERLADGDYDQDLTLLWYLTTTDLRSWLRYAQPDENDVEACGALRRLRGLIDDFTKTTERNRNGQAEG